MKIIDVIRSADSKNKIYALLNAYIDGLRHSVKREHVAPQLLALPINGEADLRARLTILFVELDIASKRLDNDMLILYKEALAIVASALHRIQLLENNLRTLQLPKDVRALSNGADCRVD
jgi:hypothetical protein